MYYINKLAINGAKCVASHSRTLWNSLQLELEQCRLNRFLEVLHLRDSVAYAVSSRQVLQEDAISPSCAINT